MCSIADDFAVDMGALEIIGVTTADHRKFTCINGQTCKLEGIWGNHLTSSDQFAVLDTCGTIAKADFVPMTGMSVNVDPPGPAVCFYSRVLRYFSRLVYVVHVRKLGVQMRGFRNCCTHLYA